MKPLITIEDVRQAARRRLPRTVFDVIDGGAADERTVAMNRAGFGHVALRPRALADTTVRDISTSLFGQRVSLPVLLDPCGFQRLAHGEGELAVARAAAAADTIMVLSSASGNPLEDVAHVAGGPKWLQASPPADRGACTELVARARDSGYQALVVTIDTGVRGLRERDLRNRLTAPLRVTPRLIAQGASRPAWALGFLRGTTGRGTLGFPALPDGARRNLHAFRSMQDADQAVADSVRPVTFADLEWLRAQWTGPLLVKGVQRADECERMVGLGVDGIVVSNHGGRQLDTGVGTIEILPEVVDAVGGRCEILLDGGIRRGSDVVKAIALGASAVLIGRPYLFGLAIGGADGVRHVLEILRFEIDHTMALLGCCTLDEVDRSTVTLRPGFAGSLET